MFGMLSIVLDRLHDSSITIGVNTVVDSLYIRLQLEYPRRKAYHNDSKH